MCFAWLLPFTITASQYRYSIVVLAGRQPGSLSVFRSVCPSVCSKLTSEFHADRCDCMLRKQVQRRPTPVAVFISNLTKEGVSLSIPRPSTLSQWTHRSSSPQFPPPPPLDMRNTRSARCWSGYRLRLSKKTVPIDLNNQKKNHPPLKEGVQGRDVQLISDPSDSPFLFFFLSLYLVYGPSTDRSIDRYCNENDRDMERWKRHGESECE